MNVLNLFNLSKFAIVLALYLWQFLGYVRHFDLPSRQIIYVSDNTLFDLSMFYNYFSSLYLFLLISCLPVPTTRPSRDRYNPQVDLRSQSKLTNMVLVIK